MDEQLNLQNDETHDQLWAVKGSGNVGYGVDLQIGTLLSQQIRIGNLLLTKYLKKTSFRMNVLIELSVMLILGGCNVQ